MRRPRPISPGHVTAKRGLLTLGLFVAVMAFLPAASAQATTYTGHIWRTVELGTYVVHVQVDGNSPDVINTSEGSGLITVTDDPDGGGPDQVNFNTDNPDTVPVDPDGGCAGGTGTASCDATGVSGIYIKTGSGNDILTTGVSVAHGTTVEDGPGDDSITGGASGDNFLASDGAGDDSYVGGGGNDVVGYAARAQAVTVTLDGAANDGTTGGNETDNVQADSVVGTYHADVLTGDSGNNALAGCGGNDLINGGPGADGLFDIGYVATVGCVPAAGNATYIGGTGGDTILDATTTDSDTVDYSGRSAPVSVDIGTGANDGEVGEGDDVQIVENVLGGSNNDQITGDGNANILSGGAGTDTLAGGAGNDTFAPGAGIDTMTDTAGSDTASYGERSVGVTISNDGVANDGEPGEGDSVASSIEGLTGGAGNDTLNGGANVDNLTGGSGNDTYRTGLSADNIADSSGSDTVTYDDRSGTVTVSLDGGANDGEAGENENVPNTIETIVGGNGSDFLTGTTSAVTLKGGNGNDHLAGGVGNDTLYGDEGNDTLTSIGDSAVDNDFCGNGDDVADGDNYDTIDADCNTINRDGLPGPSGVGPAFLAPGGGSTNPTAPSCNSPPKAKSVKLNKKKKRVTVKLAAGSSACKGSLKLRGAKKVKGKTVNAGSASFTLVAGKETTVNVKLSKQAKKLLKGKRKLSFKVTVTLVATT